MASSAFIDLYENDFIRGGYSGERAAALARSRWRNRIPSREL
jgi:hypothetical protein